MEPFFQPAPLLLVRRFRQTASIILHRGCSPMWSTRSLSPVVYLAATGRSRKSNGDRTELRLLNSLNLRRSAESKSDGVADAVPTFIDRNRRPRERVERMAPKGKVVESRAALPPAEHLLGNLAAEMCGARNPGTAVTHRVVCAARRATKMRQFVESVAN